MERPSIYQIILSAMAFMVVIAVAVAVDDANNPDVMSELVGQPFRTSDHGDNNCAALYGGGWWFKDDGNCARLNLNGDFSADGRAGVWYGVPLDANKIVKMEMKIRPMEDSES